MARRIDSLFCGPDTAHAQIRKIIGEIQERAIAAQQEVAQAIGERVQALNTRHQELAEQIDKLSKSKTKVLERQLIAIEQGLCQPAPSEDPDIAPDPSKFLLDADAVISFRTGENDFLEKIKDFGVIDETSTYSSKSYAKGPALGIMKVGNPSFLWVTSCDRKGDRRKEGGDDAVFTLSSPQDFEPVEVEDLKDGRYRAKFVPLSPGSYQLDVAIGSSGNPHEVIQGSPFPIEVRLPTEYHVIGGEEHQEGKAQLGNPGPESGWDVHHPSGVCFDDSGRFVFVVDQSNHRLQVFDFSGTHNKAVSSFGKKGFGRADFDTPCDVVADRDNRLVVTDLLNHRLQVLEFYPRTGELRHVRSVGMNGGGEAQFHFPKGLAFNDSGHLLVCDSGNHRVQVFDVHEGFKFIREFGQKGNGDGQFTSPLDITVNCSEEILVSDSENRIQVFDASGNFLRSFGVKGRKDGMFNYPASIATNDENALFVCDQGNHRVQVLNATDGSFLHKWGGKKKKAEGEEGEEPDEEKPPEWSGLKAPAGVAVNASGTVVVTDYQNNVIYAF